MYPTIALKICLTTIILYFFHIPTIVFASTCDQYSPSQLLQKANAYHKFIQTSAQRHKVSPALIKAVITAESCFREKAVSPKGASGLMQLMPATARRFGVGDRFNPAQNIEGGTRYLRWLLDRYNGSVPHAVAAYNAGEQRVDQHGSDVPIRETRNYTRQVLNAYRKLNSIASTQPTLSYTKYTNLGLLPKPLPATLTSKAIWQKTPQSPVTATAHSATLPLCIGKLSTQLLKNTQRRGGGNYNAYYYRVKAGDDIKTISKTLNISSDNLMPLGRSSHEQLPVPGQWIKIMECFAS